MELHTVNKEKPTEKLVGRKRETVEKESKEHYPVTARGLRDPFSTGKFDGIFGSDKAVRHGFLHLLLGDGGANPVGGRSLGHSALGGQVFHAHPAQKCAWGLRKRGRGRGDQQWRRRRQRAGEQYDSPLCHLYIFWEKGRGLRRGAKIGNVSPLTVKNRALNGQKIVEVTVLPIQWFALEKSYGLGDIIKDIYKGNRMAPTKDELIKIIIYERFFLVIALGAITFKNVEWNSSLKWWTSTRQQGVLEIILS
jgi:hypothetical protein